MPKIEIKELDLSQATGTVGTDIPFIPGLSVKADAPFETPVLCSSVSSFESLFGAEGYIMKDNDISTFHGTKAGDVDRSYIMAKELLAAGMPIYYWAYNGNQEGASLNGFLTSLKTYLGTDDLKDMGEYTFKYLTTGGYSNYNPEEAVVEGQTPKNVLESYNVSTSLLAIAEARGDCVAIIEGQLSSTHSTIDPAESESLFYKLSNESTLDSNGEFGTAFFPWAKYNTTKTYTTSNDAKVSESIMPAAYGYLLNLASNIKVTPNWLAMAGTTRGIVPNIKSLELPANTRLSNVIADAYQPTRGVANSKRALNAITNIKPYGLTIWGNRTLKTIDTNGPKATNFLNTRNMMSDIKKVLYTAAKSQLFEQNCDTLWMNFQAEVRPFLEQLKAGNGISDYKLIKSNTTITGGALSKEEFACVVRIYPLYAVESFEITVVVADNEVSVG